jgi:hypothetical protein
MLAISQGKARAPNFGIQTEIRANEKRKERERGKKRKKTKGEGKGADPYHKVVAFECLGRKFSQCLRDKGTLRLSEEG